MMAPFAFAFLTPGTAYLLIIFVIIFALIAQMRVSSAIGKYSKVRAHSGLTGAQTAREILNAADIHDVDIEVGNSFLGDHYDPTQKKLVLSPNVANDASVASVGI